MLEEIKATMDNNPLSTLNYEKTRNTEKVT